MRNDYRVTTPTEMLSVEVEKTTVETLKAMEQYTQIKLSEMVNTALKRFISAHKDYLPPHFSAPSAKK